MYRRRRAAGDSSTDILYRYSLAAPPPPMQGRGGCPRTGRGVAKRASRQTFFKKSPPPSRFTPPRFSKGWYLKKYFFTIHNHCCSPAIAGGIVACFHGLCEAGTQIKAKGFVPRAVWRVSSHGRPYTQSRRGGNAPLCRHSSVGRAAAL